MFLLLDKNVYRFIFCSLWKNWCLILNDFSWYHFIKSCIKLKNTNWFDFPFQQLVILSSGVLHFFPTDKVIEMSGPPGFWVTIVVCTVGVCVAGGNETVVVCGGFSMLMYTSTGIGWTIAETGRYGKFFAISYGGHWSPGTQSVPLLQRLSNWLQEQTYVQSVGHVLYWSS